MKVIHLVSRFDMALLRQRMLISAGAASTQPLLCEREKKEFRWKKKE
jgi:hypothetical protein